MSSDTLDDFHHLIQDEHVRRYLLDGEVRPREWSEASVRTSTSLFAMHGIGVWLVRIKDGDRAIGFCGFLDVSSSDLAPQVVYALSERFTGRGYGTEMATGSAPFWPRSIKTTRGSWRSSGSEQ